MGKPLLPLIRISTPVYNTLYDEYRLCRNHQMVFTKEKQKSKSGYKSEVTVYECEDCGGCPYKSKCTKAKGDKRLYLSKSFLEKRQEFYENILRETGIRNRMNRSIQVEGAFGVLKNDYEFFFCSAWAIISINYMHGRLRSRRNDKKYVTRRLLCLVFYG